MQTIDKTVYENKYGFHPCTREVYKKLKKVRYYLHVDRIQQAALKRWSAKLAKNRVKWQFVGITFNEAPSYTFTSWKAIPWKKPEVCPVNLYLMAQEYIKAKAVKSPELVKAISISEEILDQWIADANEWAERVKEAR